MTRPSVAKYWEQRETLPGWFTTTDFLISDFLLDWQESREPIGDLAELGVYKGKSAILLGLHRRAGEEFTVCDLFGNPAENVETRQHNARWYGSFDRQDFENNYLRFLDVLPTVVEGPTAEILDFVPSGTHRFVHTDASGLYADARGDLAAARAMLRPDGIVSVTGWRAEHFAGLAAGLWESVLKDGLKPICVSPVIYYGTWGDPQTAQDALLTWAETRPELTVDVEEVLGARFVRVGQGAFPAAELSRSERIAKSLLPPVITRRLGQWRRRRLQSADSATTSTE